MWIALLFAFSALQSCSGTGQIAIKLVSYRNPNGRGSNGNYCDGGRHFRGIGGKCDHYFKVCLDYPRGPLANHDSCLLGQFTTPAIKDQDDITFGTTIRGTDNPTVFNFPTWPGGVLVKVLVNDKDKFGNHDFVEYMSKVVSKTPDPKTRPQLVDVSLGQRTTLTVQLAVICDTDYYGGDCDTYCRASSGSRGYYKCDPAGQKVCLPGYFGRDCTVYCDETTGNFDCLPDGSKKCHPGWSGTDCQISSDQYQLSLKLVKYENPSGRDANNEYCDGSVVQVNECDQFFIVCLDVPNGPINDRDSCPLGRFVTKPIKNSNNIVFGRDIRGDANPRLLNIPTWPGGVLVKVEVNDDDKKVDHDEVDYLHTVVLKSGDLSQPSLVTIQQRTLLKIELAVLCRKNNQGVYGHCDAGGAPVFPCRAGYYGRDCDVYCDDTTGHYDCLADGSKRCHPGWRGRDCDYPAGTRRPPYSG